MIITIVSIDKYLLSARQWTWHFTLVISLLLTTQQSHERGMIIISILHRSILMCHDLWPFVPSHTASKRQSQRWNPALSDSNINPLPTMLHFYSSSPPDFCCENNHLLIVGVYFKCNPCLVFKFLKNLEKCKEKKNDNLFIKRYHFYHFGIVSSSIFSNIHTNPYLPHKYSKHYVFKCYVFIFVYVLSF